MRGLALALAALLSACAAPYPPERVERDRIILDAVKPCVERYSHIIVNPNMVSVEQDGRLRAWQWGDRALGQSYEFDQCITEVYKGLKVGPWAPGRLAKSGPTSVPVSTSGPLVLVPIRLNGVDGTMIVAINSQLTIVTPSYAKRAGVNLVAESPTTHVRRGDQALLLPYARTRSLEVGDASIEALDVAVGDGPADAPQNDGVLGANVLNQFRMNIDRRNSRLTLEPLRPAGADTSPEITVTSREWRVPVWAVGDEWRLRWNSATGSGTYVQRVEGEETVDGVVHYVVSSGARRIYYAKATIGWHFEKQDEVVTLRRSPPMAWDWPLTASKTWDSKYERQERDGKVGQRYGRCMAIGETSVSVPAGVFTTLLIRCRNRAGGITTEYWYAEEVKTWVRRRSVSEGDRIDELVSYSPGAVSGSSLPGR